MKISNINNLILSSKLGKAAIAEQCGISRTTLDNILCGSDVKISTLEKLAAVLNVPVSYFFEEKPTTVSTMTGNVIISEKKKVGDIDARRYESDSPDVLRAQIALLDMNIKEKDSQIKEKDSQIKEKDSQIKEKDSQIKQLLDILQAFKTK